MRAVLLLLLSASLSAALTLGARVALTPEPPSAPTSERPRVRVRPQRPQPVACPEDEETEALLAELRQEIGLLEREAASLQQSARMLGTPLPEDLPEAVQPEAVQAAVEALLPPGAKLAWSCDAVPCSGALVLDPGEPDAMEQAQRFQRALEETYPGATRPAVMLDARAQKVDDPEQAAGVSVFFTVVPRLEQPEHRARLYFLTRQSRSEADDRLRELLSE